jgi:hypothetical protein
MFKMIQLNLGNPVPFSQFKNVKRMIYRWEKDLLRIFATGCLELVVYISRI